jgi:hypothetical protein
MPSSISPSQASLETHSGQLFATAHWTYLKFDLSLSVCRTILIIYWVGSNRRAR